MSRNPLFPAVILTRRTLEICLVADLAALEGAIKYIKQKMTSNPLTPLLYAPPPPRSLLPLLPCPLRTLIKLSKAPCHLLPDKLPPNNYVRLETLSNLLERRVSLLGLLAFLGGKPPRSRPQCQRGPWRSSKGLIEGSPPEGNCFLLEKFNPAF